MIVSERFAFYDRTRLTGRLPLIKVIKVIRFPRSAAGQRPALPCALALLIAVCAGCASQVEHRSEPAAVAAITDFAAVESDYQSLARSQPQQVYQLDPAASVIRIYVFRGGRAAMAGHNHVVAAPRLRGYAYVPAAGLAEARFDLQLRLDELAFDEPAARAATGAGFSGVLAPDAIDGTRKHMLESLDAEHYPLVELVSVHMAGELPKPVVEVALRLHGQQRLLLLPLDLRLQDGSLQVRGALALRQSDFGAKPYSVLGGLLAVQDELAIEFDLHGVAVSP